MKSPLTDYSKKYTLVQRMSVEKEGKLGTLCNNILPLCSFVNNFFETLQILPTSLNKKLRQYDDYFLSK
jgi:hypothetical protein